MSRKGMTERLQNLRCSDEKKSELRDYLFSCLAKGKNFKLMRNRVMIMDNEKENKYIILELVPTTNENKHMFMCPKCSSMEVSNYLTTSVPYDAFQ